MSKEIPDRQRGDGFTRRETTKEIITAYLGVFEHLRESFAVESDLPYTKEKIRRAIEHELTENPSSELKKYLEIAYALLETFMPYDEYRVIAGFKDASRHVMQMVDTGDPVNLIRCSQIMEKADGDLAVKIQEGISTKIEARYAQIRSIGTAV